MAVTDDMNDLSSSSHHRRMEAEKAKERAALQMKPIHEKKPTSKINEGSYTSIESHSEEEEYLANDPYLAELLNSNHSRTTSAYVPKSASVKTMTSLSAHEAARTWNDLSSVHSKADTARDEHHDSSSSFMDSTSSMASFGNSEDEHSNHHSESCNDDDDDDEDLSRQKLAFQKLFDSPRKDKEAIALAANAFVSSSNTSNNNNANALPSIRGPDGRRKFRSSSVKVRPTYHGPNLGLIEESSLH